MSRLTKREREIVILVLEHAQDRKLVPWSLADVEDMASASRKMQRVAASAPGAASH